MRPVPLISVNRCTIQGAGVEPSDERALPAIEQVHDLAAAVQPQFGALVPHLPCSSKGFGIENGEEIRCPLDPAKLLVLSRRPRTPSARVDWSRSAASNRDVAFACRHFVIAHPRERVRVAELELPAKRPTLRFNTGPLLRKLPDGRTIEDGDILHMWVPRR